LDVKGKFVLLLRHEPNKDDPASPFYGSSYTRHSYFVTKARKARDHGAAGMILFTDPKFHGSADDLRLAMEMQLEPSKRGREESEKTGKRHFLAVHISQSLAMRMVEPTGWDLKTLQEAVDSGKRPVEINLPELAIEIAIEKKAQAQMIGARNVVGMLPGRDPALKEEWIVVGGHHDHVGSFSGSGDTVFNGADDNASGVSGVLELAEAFTSLVRRPKRTFVFVTYSAEELGLFGSRAIVEQKKIPLDKVTFVLNLDMIGRNSEKELEVFSGGYGSAIREIVEEANEDVGLPLKFSGVPKQAASDYYPFHAEGIPFLYLFTGLHEDYHKTTDHADCLHYPRMQSITRLAYKILQRLAETQPDGN
jgi:hypothetical protein